jgi:protein tyrosine phosphatase (PTP) superfamily phosphohydrolase (DUF442 family)
MNVPIKCSGLDAPNPWQVAPRIFTCGQVSEADVQWFAAEAGVTAVLNLLPPTQELAEEDGWWADAGVDYDVVPVIWMQPTMDGILACLNWLERHQEETVLVHCSMNYRVSCLVHLIRRLRGNIFDASHDAWLQEIWEPNAIWMALIDQVCALEDSPLTAVTQRLNAFDF